MLADRLNGENFMAFPTGW